MNLRNIFTIYRKEVRDSLRDRRTLMSTLLIPALVMPLMFFGMGRIMSQVMSKAAEGAPSIAVIGGEDSPNVLAQLRAAHDDERKRDTFRVVSSENYKQAISDKKLQAAVEIPAGFESALEKGEAKTVMIYYFEGEIKSGIAYRALDKFFSDYREKLTVAKLTARGLPPTLVKPFDVKRQNVAPPEKVGGNLFGGIVPYVIIILCFTGAMYPAMDITAGEKERGTMETLLCSPVARIDIVLGKFLLVLTGSFTAIVSMLMSMTISAALGGSLFMSKGAAGAAAASARVNTPADIIPSINPAGILGVLAMVAPVAILFAAVTFTVALFAKSYKEAQSYLAPMIIVVIMPAVIGMLPGIDLNLPLALVPILNLSLVCKEMLSGVWHWNYIALIFGSSCVYAGIALTMAVKMFQREDVIFRA